MLHDKLANCLLTMGVNPQLLAKSTTFRELNFGNNDLVDLANELEETLNLDFIPETEIRSWRTLSDVQHYLFLHRPELVPVAEDDSAALST